MKDLPNPFWAALFIGIACALAAVALFAHDKTDTSAVITMASSIITGAFGYIQGVRDGKNSVSVPLDPPASTQVTVNPTQQQETGK